MKPAAMLFGAIVYNVSVSYSVLFHYFEPAQ
jgi:hypothetical protein